MAIYPNEVEIACALEEPEPIAYHEARLLEEEFNLSGGTEQGIATTSLDSIALILTKNGGCRAYEPQVLADARVRALRVAREQDARGSIHGIGDLSWGATLEQVRSRYPSASASRLPGLPVTEVRVVRTSVGGQLADITLTVHSTLGLITGRYYFDPSMGEACERSYESVKKAISSRYPLVQPSEVRRNSSASLEICDAVEIGKGRLVTVWADTASSITLGVIPSRAVFVDYESDKGKDFRALQVWLERRRAF